MEFQVGSKVMLNSGGPVMTVIETQYDEDGYVYNCQWKNTAGITMTSWFKEVMLREVIEVEG